MLYAEFVEGFDGHKALVDSRENIFMTRTFSKNYGLGWPCVVGLGYGPSGDREHTASDARAV